MTVALNAASGKTVSVNWATADGTANAPADYTADNGSLTFAPGETSKSVTVSVNGDTVVEPNETYRGQPDRPDERDDPGRDRDGDDRERRCRCRPGAATATTTAAAAATATSRAARSENHPRRHVHQDRARRGETCCAAPAAET